MIRVNIESPLSAPTPEGVEENKAYARACLLDSLKRGEAPLAMHLLYPQVLDDTVPEERAMGIRAGCEHISTVQIEAVYVDRGISSGMKHGMNETLRWGKKIEFRSLEGKPLPTGEDLHREAIPHWAYDCSVYLAREYPR